MTFLQYLREQWRFLAFYLLAFLILSSVVLLDMSRQHAHMPMGDLLYISVLALFILAVYVVVEYLIRRPFYEEVRYGLNADAAGPGDSLPSQARITEHRLLTELMRRQQTLYLNDLADRDERRRFFETFMTRFAHQMKTPMTVIQLLIGEMRQTLTDGSRQRELGPSNESLLHVIDSIEEECHRLEASLSTMLYTGRLNAFSFDARMEIVDVGAVLRAGVNEHKSEWIRRRIFPKIESASDITAFTDQKWFAFVIDQLIRNALQYGYKVNEAGAPVDEPASFVIRVATDKDAVRVTIQDEGIGIPKQDLRRVFDPFYTGANGRSHSRATGMGLYLVKAVADKLGHAVALESEEGKGTTVTLTMGRSDYLRPAHVGADTQVGVRT